MGETLARVIDRLAEAALDPARTEELARFVDDGDLPEPLTTVRCRRLLTTTLRHLHRLRVWTLDSYFIQIARSFSLELGLPLRWWIVEEIEWLQPPDRVRLRSLG